MPSRAHGNWVSSSHRSPTDAARPDSTDREEARTPAVLVHWTPWQFDMPTHPGTDSAATMRLSQQRARTTYVQVAGRFTFDGRSFTLLDLAPATVYLTDRPDESVGYLPTGLFLDRWYADESGSSTRTVAAVLSFLDPDRADAADARLLLGLPRIRATGMEYQAQVTAGELPSAAGACVLFISPDGTPRTPALAANSTGMVEPPAAGQCESDDTHR